MIAREYFGGSVFFTTGGTHVIPRGARVAWFGPPNDTGVIQLPDATNLPVGYDVYIGNTATFLDDVDVEDSDGGTLKSNLAVGSTLLCILKTPGTSAGSWYTSIDGTAIGFGALIPNTREFFTLSISADTEDYNVRTQVDLLGYGGVNPVVVDLTIDAGVIVTGSTTSTYALSTGTFPALSNVNILARGRIWGRGGDGGNGGDNTGTVEATAGGNGGVAARFDAPVQLEIPFNGGIVGGSGGGGGGAYASTGNVGKGGGGGGAFALGQGGTGPGDASDGSDSIRFQGGIGLLRGRGGPPTPSSDAGRGGDTGFAIGGDAGVDSSDTTGGAGGLAGDAIQFGEFLSYLGDGTVDRVSGDVVIAYGKIAAAASVLSPTVSAPPP